MIDGRLKEGVLSEDPDEGIYNSQPSRFPRTSYRTEDGDPNRLIDNQITGIKTVPRRVPDDPDGDKFFITQWVIALTSSNWRFKAYEVSWWIISIRRCTGRAAR